MYKIIFILLLTFSSIYAKQQDNTTIIWKKYLHETKEPALADLNNTTSYRIIVHSAMSGADTVSYLRITKRDDLYFAYIGWLDSNGLKYLEYTLPLSLNTWNRLTKFITNDSFYNLKNNDNFVGFDGGFTIIESIENGKYHYVERWEPKMKVEDRQLVKFNEAFSEFYYKYFLRIERCFLLVKEAKERN